MIIKQNRPQFSNFDLLNVIGFMKTNILSKVNIKAFHIVN